MTNWHDESSLMTIKRKFRKRRQRFQKLQTGAKSQNVDKLTCWHDNKLKWWQADKNSGHAKRCNKLNKDNITRWHDDMLTCWHIDKLTSWHVDMMTCWHHSVTNMKFWYERISEYIRIEKNNTNECPNIFVSKKGYEYDTNEYSWRKIFEYIRISQYSTHYEKKNMIRTNIRTYSDQKNDTNEYTNIFVSKKGYEYDTNEYSWHKIFEYIRISEYSSHYGWHDEMLTWQADKNSEL